MRLKGIHARNDQWFENSDYILLSILKPTHIKMMSFINEAIFRHIQSIVPGIKFIVRLYHPSFNQGGHLSYSEFADHCNKEINRLKQFTDTFQIHNEPNHKDGIEGWGSTLNHAYDFGLWYLNVIHRIRIAHSEKLNLIFPGLAMPSFAHNDLGWLNNDMIKLAIEYSDGLGCHCYWQNPHLNESNHLSSNWGLYFKQYHGRFPDKKIYILEAGNSNHQNGYGLPESVMSKELVEWFMELNKPEYSYLECATPFIMSSPDMNWDGFSWREGSRMKQCVYDMGKL